MIRRAALPFALAAYLHLAPGPAWAQTPDATLCTAPPDATAAELVQRLRLCSHALAVAHWRITILDRAVADLLAAVRVDVPAGEVLRDTAPEAKETR